MSTEIIKELSFYALNFCPVLKRNKFYELLVLSRYAAYSVQFFLWVLGLLLKEFHLVLLGLSLTIDGLLNYALREIIRQPTPNPGCGETFGMPSFAAQHVAVLYVLVVSFPVVWKSRPSWWGLFLMTVLYLIASLAQVSIGYNTAFQVLIGTIIGAAEGIIYQFIIFVIITKYWNTLRRWKIVRWLGITNDYCDISKIK